MLERFGKRLYDEESVVRITTIDTLGKNASGSQFLSFYCKAIEKVAKEDTDKRYENTPPKL